MIRAAIEFCRRIQATDLLFKDIYELCVERGCENAFLFPISKTIISGKLKKVKIPELIIKKLFKAHENKKEGHKMLDRIVLSIKVNQYKCNGDDDSIKKYLER